jgi:hypothetical protein
VLGLSAAMREMTYDPTSFSAGRDCGTRVAACLARLTALELMEHARWWNRRRRRVMAGALVACAEELERQADGAEGDASGPGRARSAPDLRALAATPS